MLLALFALAHQADTSMDMSSWPVSREVAPDPQETHFKNLKQLTFGGENAECYVNVDGTRVSWQATVGGYPDEQIFGMNLDGTDKHLISTGKGRCTCSYFTPDDQWVIFSSTHATSPGKQTPPDMSKGYVWTVNPNYAMYKARPDGSELTPITHYSNAYVAETTIAPNGKYMAWTSDKDGDLDIYRSDLDGKHVKRLTNQVGYDGGPFVSWDSKHIVYRRDDLKNQGQVDDYRALLKQHLIRPTTLEIWIMDADGSHKHQVTHLGCASFAPFLLPDNRRIIFSSNYGDAKGREFDLFLINLDGSGLERVTHTPEFDGFPMLTADGKKLIFASNRFGTHPHETNIFVADWVN
jgi:Tol biopolymer transport system component